MKAKLQQHNCSSSIVLCTYETTKFMKCRHSNITSRIQTEALPKIKQLKKNF